MPSERWIVSEYGRPWQRVDVEWVSGDVAMLRYANGNLRRVTRGYLSGIGIEVPSTWHVS